MCFSFDSQYIASGGEDGLIDFALASDGSLAASSRVGAPINSISWNPKAHVIAYASEATAQTRTAPGGPTHPVHLLVGAL